MKTKLLFSLLLIGFFATAQNQGSIPDSIKNYTILVMKADQGIMQKMYNKNLGNAMGEYYQGPYELVGKKDLESPNYADLTKYRYTINYVQVGSITSGQTGRDEAIYDVCFYDRLQQVYLNKPGVQSVSYIGAVRRFSKLLAQSTK
jgi:hypothetical protein